MTINGDDADMYSNYPQNYGWPADPHAQPINTGFRWTSPQGVTYQFPGGVAAGTEVLISTALDIVAAQAGFQCYPDNDPNVCGMWGSEVRQSRNSSDYSIHSWGIVTDVNAPWNPNATDVPPAGPYRVPLNTGDLIWDLGCRWGGDWGDWMHYPEIHFSPAQVAQWTAEYGGDYDPTNGDDEVTDDDIEKIAKRAAEITLQEMKVIRYNTYNASTKKEEANQGSLADAVGAAATSAARAWEYGG